MYATSHRIRDPELVRKWCSRVKMDHESDLDHRAATHLHRAGLYDDYTPPEDKVGSR